MNGPIKRHIRGLIARRIGECFDEHSSNCAAERQKPLALRNIPELDIPKPSLEQCIKDLIHLLSNDFKSDKFRQGKQKSCLSASGPDIDIPIRAYRSSVMPPMTAAGKLGHRKASNPYEREECCRLPRQQVS